MYLNSSRVYRAEGEMASEEGHCAVTAIFLSAVVTAPLAVTIRVQSYVQSSADGPVPVGLTELEDNNRCNAPTVA